MTNNPIPIHGESEIVNREFSWGEFEPDEIEDFESPDPDPELISYTSSDFDVEGLIRRLEKGDILIPTFGETEVPSEPIETARFQRPYVWTKNQMDKFIESILLGYPIPGIFLVQQQDRRYLVLDGQQRLRTLQAFKSRVVNKREFSLKNVGEKFKGLTFATLRDDQRRQFENTFIQATIVQSAPNSLDAIYQVFERLNSGGTQLRPHEIRVALYSGALVDWITTLSKNTNWRMIYGRTPSHLRDQELLMRIVALDVAPEAYKRPLKKFLNDFSEAHRNTEGINTLDIEQRFDRAATLMLASEGANVLKFSGPAINAAWTEALFVGLMDRLRTSEPTSNEVHAAISKMRSNSDLISVITRSTADDENVKRRLSISKDAFSK